MGQLVVRVVRFQEDGKILRLLVSFPMFEWTMFVSSLTDPKTNTQNNHPSSTAALFD